MHIKEDRKKETGKSQNGHNKKRNKEITIEIWVDQLQNRVNQLEDKRSDKNRLSS